jgi:hypothetical protein
VPANELPTLADQVRSGAEARSSDFQHDRTAQPDSTQKASHE